MTDYQALTETLGQDADESDPITSQNYPALGFDPAPGTVATVDSLATNLSTVATNLGHARDTLSEIGRSDSIWQGDAADGFRAKVGELPDYLDKATTSLGDAARALDNWSADLTALQRTAHNYETQAAQAMQRLNQARNNPNLKLAGEQFPDQQEADTAQTELDEAETELTEAQSELDTIRADAKRLLAQHQNLVDQVARALTRARDEAPEEPGFWAGLGNALESALQGVLSLGDRIGQWLHDHADLIGEIGKVLAEIGNWTSLIAAATSWIPGVGEVTTAISLAVNGAALGTEALAMAAGDKDINAGDLAMDALNMIPGTKVSGLGHALADVAGTARKVGAEVLSSEGGTLIGATRALGGSLRTGVADVLAAPGKAATEGLQSVFNESAHGLYNVTSKLGLRTFAQNTTPGMWAIAGYAGGKSVLGWGAEQLTGGVVESALPDQGGFVQDETNKHIDDKIVDKGLDVIFRRNHK